VYGVEVVLPLKLQIPLLCITIQKGLMEDENHSLQLAKLEALEERSLQVQQKLNATKLVH